MNFISNDKEKEFSLKTNDYDSLKHHNNSPKSFPNFNQHHLNISSVEDSGDKLTRIIRFAVDYCRSSPNITLKHKNILNIGWRNQKYNYEVDYDLIDFNGEKLTVYKIYFIVL